MHGPHLSSSMFFLISLHSGYIFGISIVLGIFSLGSRSTPSVLSANPDSNMADIRSPFQGSDYLQGLETQIISSIDKRAHSENSTTRFLNRNMSSSKKEEGFRGSRINISLP